jgi:hypothetical protein
VAMKYVNGVRDYDYRIYSRNLAFFSSLAAEKSSCVKYADFCVWRS